MADEMQRGWAPYRTVARQYLHVNEDVLLGAIKQGKLRAYEKPLTHGRKPGATRENHSLWVNLSDVDEYIRSEWQPYSIR